MTRAAAAVLCFTGMQIAVYMWVLAGEYFAMVRLAVCMVAPLSRRVGIVT